MGTMIRSLFPEQHFRPPKIYRIRRPHASEPEPTEADLDLCLRGIAIIILFYVIAAVLECIWGSKNSARASGMPTGAYRLTARASSCSLQLV